MVSEQKLVFSNRLTGVQISDIYRLKKLVYPRNNFRI